MAKHVLCMPAIVTGCKIMLILPPLLMWIGPCVGVVLGQPRMKHMSQAVQDHQFGGMGEGVILHRDDKCQ